MQRKLDLVLFLKAGGAPKIIDRRPLKSGRYPRSWLVRRGNAIEMFDGSGYSISMLRPIKDAPYRTLNLNSLQ